MADVIVAEGQGDVAAGQPVMATGHSSYHHAAYAHPTNSADYYGQANAYSGANDWTMPIMMVFVVGGYAVLGISLFFACCVKRQAVAASHAAHQFVRFDPETHEQQMLKHQVVAELEPVWRKAFIGKVYTLLCMQIAITFLISFSMMQFGGYDFYVWSLTEGAWTRLASIVTSISLLIGLFCFKAKYPLNLAMLFAFTCVMSYTIGMVTTAYAAAGMQHIVIEAFAITSLVFVALTVFTIWSKIDFSFLGLILPLLLFTLIIWGFFGMFAFQSFAFQQVYALGGTVIFSLYVLYDTWMITQVLSYDDYVLGAVNLYLDFINLFLFILQLLTGTRRD